MVRAVKREVGSSSGANRNGAEVANSGDQGVIERRVLRSRYLAVKNLICDGREDMTRVDSDKFKLIINEVESLHQQVQKPREQVADAEALLDITNTLVTSVKAHGNEGITPSDFVSCLLQQFGRNSGASTSTEYAGNSLAWKDIGLRVSDIFKRAPGCYTMLGPMNTEMKHRKAAVRNKRVRPTESARPEELDDTGAEEKSDTDKNMSTMFNILRKNRRVSLESLVLNRNSFAQTVENLFALSFLVKDGRAEIIVDEKGSQLVSPKNAPAANAVVSGEVCYNHFVFRFDFKDWKLMKTSVGAGEELMPQRNSVNLPNSSRTESVAEECVARPTVNLPNSSRVDSVDDDCEEAAAPTTPIRKLSRNRGLVLQEHAVVEDSPESDDVGGRAAVIRKGKRKMR